MEEKQTLQNAPAGSAGALMSGTVVGLRAVAAAVPSSRASVAVPPPIATDRWSNVLNESRGWVEEHCPRFESAESDLDLAYYYRWRLFHLHLGRAPAAPAGSPPHGHCVVSLPVPRQMCTREHAVQ